MKTTYSQTLDVLNLNDWQLWPAFPVEIRRRESALNHHPNHFTDFNIAFNPIAKLYRVLGSFPLRIGSHKCPFDGKRIITRYEFVPISLPTLYSLAVALLYSFSLYLFVSSPNGVLPLSGHNRSNNTTSVVPSGRRRDGVSLAVTVYAGFFLTYLFGYIITFLLNLYSVRALATFLQNWVEIEECYYNCFRKPLAFAKVRRVIRLGIIINFIFFALGIFKGMGVFSPCILSFDLNCRPPGAEFSYLSWLLTIYSLFCNFFDDTKFIATFVGISEAYHGLQSQIGAIHEESCFRLGRVVTKSVLRDITRLASKVKNQALLVNRFVGSAQAVTIAMIFSLTILNLFMISDIVINKTVIPGSVSTKTLMCAVGIGRLYIKARYLEDIKREERKITEKLLELDCFPLSCEFERKFYADFMIMNPTRFVFGGVLEFNKAFLLTFIGNVSTYLIVLLQFNELAS